MALWDRLFGPKTGQKQEISTASPLKAKAIAFVDYEHWYYSYKNLFGMRPDVASWQKEISEEYEFDEIQKFIISCGFSAWGMVKSECNRGWSVWSLKPQ